MAGNSEAALPGRGARFPAGTRGRAPNGRFGNEVDDISLPLAPAPAAVRKRKKFGGTADRPACPEPLPEAPVWPPVEVGRLADPPAACPLLFPEELPLVPDPAAEPGRLAVPEPPPALEPLPEPLAELEPPPELEPLPELEPPPELEPLPPEPEPLPEPEPVPEPPEPVPVVGDVLDDEGFGAGDVGFGDAVQVFLAVGVGVGVLVGVGVGVQAGVVAADAGPPALISVTAVNASTTAARINPLAIESQIGRRFRGVPRSAPFLGSGCWLLTLCRHIIGYLGGRRWFAVPCAHGNDGIALFVSSMPSCVLSLSIGTSAFDGTARRGGSAG